MIRSPPGASRAPAAPLRGALRAPLTRPAARRNRQRSGQGSTAKHAPKRSRGHRGTTCGPVPMQVSGRESGRQHGRCNRRLFHGPHGRPGGACWLGMRRRAGRASRARPPALGFGWYRYPVEAVVDQAGRIVLPKFIRDALGLLPGTKVDISLYGAGVQVMPAGRTARLVEEEGVLVSEGETPVDDDVLFGLIDAGR